MSDSEKLAPVIPYELLNTDWDTLPNSGKESRLKYKACDEAFRQFEHLRGEVLSQAIAVENELDRIISWYFVPRLMPEKHRLRNEEDLRREALIDLILGQESFTISSKRKTVVSIMELAENVKSSSKDLKRILESIMDIRNQFAHRKVGVDWQTQDVALWHATKQRWGFPVFDSDGRKKEKQWHDRIPENLGDLYTRFCQLANTIAQKVCTEILIQREDNSIDEQESD